MSLSARGIALQGLGYATLVVALQGFAPAQDAPAAPIAVTTGGGGVFREPTRTTLFVDEGHDALALQIQQEDDMIIAAVARLIVTGALG